MINRIQKRRKAMRRMLLLLLLDSSVHIYASNSSTASTSVRALCPQEGVVSDDEVLLGGELVEALLVAHQLTPATRTRVGKVLAAYLVQKEREIEDKRVFAKKLNEFRDQLDLVNAEISRITQANTYALIYLSGKNFYRGKSIQTVQEFIDAIETNLMNRTWGTFIPREIPRGDGTVVVDEVVDPAAYVNEDSIAGSWFAFLIRLENDLLTVKKVSELAAANQAPLGAISSTPSYRQQAIDACLKKIHCLACMCKFLKDAARDKKIGAEYRTMVENFFQPEDKTGSDESAKKRRIQK